MDLGGQGEIDVRGRGLRRRGCSNVIVHQPSLGSGVNYLTRRSVTGRSPHVSRTALEQVAGFRFLSKQKRASRRYCPEQLSRNRPEENAGLTRWKLDRISEADIRKSLSGSRYAGGMVMARNAALTSAK